MRGLLNHLEFLIIAILSVVVELFAGYYAIEGLLDFRDILIVHAALSALLLLWAGLRKLADRRFSITLAIATAIMGPFGALGTLLSFSAWFLSPHSRSGADDWYDLLFPEWEHTPEELIYQEVRMKKRSIMNNLDTDVAPLSDVFENGTIDERVEVIAYLARNYKPHFNDALKKALNNNEPAIRVQAAALAARVESEHRDEIDKFEKALKAKPGDLDILRNLADAYDRYALSGLLADVTAHEVRGNAISIYEQLAEATLDKSSHHLALIRLYLRNGEPFKALSLLNSEVNGVENIPLKMLPWTIEALFQTAHFDELRAAARYWKDRLSSEDHPIALIQSLQFWGGGETSGYTN